VTEARDRAFAGAAFASVSDHFHPEGFANAGDSFADGPEPDDPEGLSRDFGDGVVEPGKDGGLGPFFRLGGEAVHIGHQVQQAREDVLGDGLGAVTADVADGEMALACGLEIDVVHSGGDDLDELEIFCRVHLGGSDDGFVSENDRRVGDARGGLLASARGIADEFAERFDSGEVDVAAVGRVAVEKDDFIKTVVGHERGGKRGLISRARPSPRS